MRLNTRMLLFILTTFFIVFGSGIGYISFRFKKKAMEDAVNIGQAISWEYAFQIKAMLDKTFGFSKAMAESLLILENAGIEEREQLQFEVLKNALEENPYYIASFLQWDLSDCDSSYHKIHGRRRYITYREIMAPGSAHVKPSSIDTMKGYVDLDTFNPDNPYYITKRQLCEYIIDPYFYSYSNIEKMPEDSLVSADAILETTIIVPIIENNKFRALAGVDIPLNHFQELVKSIRPFDESYAFILSNNGAFVAHPDINNLAKNVDILIPKDKVDFSITDKIKAGEEFSFILDDREEGKLFYLLSPIIISETNMPWSIGIRVPVRVIMAEANRNFYISLIVGFLGLLILTVLIWWISRTITLPIRKTTELLKEIALGKTHKLKKIKVSSRDEIGEMAQSANTLLDKLDQTATFAQQIGEGNLDADYKLISKDDKMGSSLIDMREKLRESKEEIMHKNQELEKLSMVAEKVDNAVMIMDNYGNLEWVNEAFVNMYGYRIEDFKDEKGKNLKLISTHPKIDQMSVAVLKTMKQSIMNP